MFNKLKELIAQKTEETVIEASQYDASTDFEGDISKIQQSLKTIEDILDDDKFNNWLDSTEENFSGSNVGENLEKVLVSFESLKNNFNDFYNDIVDASTK